MKNIAFVFTHGPHGNANGREGLDALLASSALTRKIGIFFIADGILLLLPQQQPSQILAKDFIVTFGILSLYNINKFYICAESAQERGLGIQIELVLKVKWLSRLDWRKHLNTYDCVLTF